MTIDPIADMLTRIRNASLVRKAEVLVPYSKIKFAIAKILEKEKYVTNVEEVDAPEKSIKVSLLYENKKPVISSIQRVSKVGHRVYVGSKEIRPVLNGYGIAILSTSKGLMTNKDARKSGLGGEIICEVY